LHSSRSAAYHDEYFTRHSVESSGSVKAEYGVLCAAGVGCEDALLGRVESRDVPMTGDLEVMAGRWTLMLEKAGILDERMVDWQCDGRYWWKSLWWNGSAFIRVVCCIRLLSKDREVGMWKS
jgi:hypothetical protein